MEPDTVSDLDGVCYTAGTVNVGDTVQIKIHPGIARTLGERFWTTDAWEITGIDFQSDHPDRVSTFLIRNLRTGVQRNISGTFGCVRKTHRPEPPPLTAWD